MVARRFNAIGVEFSLRKHGYSEGIYGGLRLESVTPTALKCSICNMNYIILRQKIWWITPKKHNTYGVDLLTTRITQGRLTPTLGYQRYNAFSVELQMHYILCDFT